jgi:predicted transcriptional regulator
MNRKRVRLLSSEREGIRLRSRTDRGVLLSINNTEEKNYVELIKNGNKKYEYRKQVFWAEDFDIAFISVTGSHSTVSVVIEVIDVLDEFVDDLWEMTKNRYPGMTKKEFYHYFKTNKEQNKKGHAIKIGKVYCCKPFHSKEVLNVVPNQPPVHVYDVNKKLSNISMKACTWTD